MKLCNYVALDTGLLDPFSPYFDDLFDLDILYTEEGIYINVSTEE